MPKITEDGSHIEADGVGEYLLPEIPGLNDQRDTALPVYYGGVMPIRFTRRELAMVGASTLGRRKPRPHSPLDRLRVRPARLEIRALFLRDFCGALLRPPIRLKARVLDVLELGHATGVFAPGLKLPPGRLNQLRRRVLLAHGLAVQAIRARSRAGTQVGPAENVNVVFLSSKPPSTSRQPSAPPARSMRPT